ncbi:dsrm domain-containing protein/Methyltransf_23 domain-containing protein [Cephalotus follicularis]|uniref:Small RNA 2'-O-methyltransferase n=1 Tax=Cephalotus follicularis TaxID=3775 RepID=A0A1Q3BCW5_CEPFO|nr:dsrm domain-containing protein/Methyltransf_23 domain-containing protein [Cephalotus follicularis]
METKGSPAVVVKKPPLTPKAIIHQKFGSKACYTVEEVQESAQNGCPGLAIQQKCPCLYRCSLQLPECSVVSGTFKKKKDAEQSAAEMALEKLGICPSTNDPSPKELCDDIIARVKYLFSNEFLSSVHPLSGHFRAALKRDGDLYGSIPASVISVCDSKLCNLCKSLNPKVESNPLLVISYIMGAAARLSGSLITSEGHLSIRRQNPFPREIIESSVIEESGSQESIWIEAIHIPSSLEEAVKPLTLCVSTTGYYLDVIAQKLGLTDANKVLVSRSIGKASSETRLYFAAPESYRLDLSPDLLNVKEFHIDGSLNARASYFCGQDVIGDAVLASIGYTWKSKDLSHEDFSLQSYYRMVIGKTPYGLYKLSRDALLASKLPSAFTTRTNWRGSYPRDMLCSLCRQHRLDDPVFSISSISIKASSEPSRSHKKLKVADSAEKETIYANGGGTATDDVDPMGSGSTFTCKLEIFSKFRGLIIECTPKNPFKTKYDSIQHASLKVLSWINSYFENPYMHFEKLNRLADAHDIRFYPQKFLSEFSLYQAVHNAEHGDTPGAQLRKSDCTNALHTMPGNGDCTFNIEGPVYDTSASIGSLFCVIYSVSLVKESENMKELLESSEEFEFEMGTEAVVPCLEAIVTQMSVGQSVCFTMDVPPRELILAAADDSTRILPLLYSKTCCLEYTVTLLQVTEPPEDRMEQAFFSPPLSKQRMEYAVQHIIECCATNLVDFGCGSGSLLDSLLDYPTALEKIVGVDISHKSLSRAAKMLHSKLSTKSDADASCAIIKSAVLYDGSITDFDSRLHGFDIGTCLEVIEHMEEDQACQFGDVVLSSFRPRILIVSTPNYEFNVILQKSNTAGQEEDPDEKTQTQCCKFRNHDHKFEWTREQFNSWASGLAERHNYSVEFSGVGGSADVEPGFASQIAVFRRGVLSEVDDLRKDTGLADHYKIIWEWNGGQ